MKVECPWCGLHSWMPILANRYEKNKAPTSGASL